ncbi:MAG: hypothetical protein Q4G51_08645 [Dermatophilus congolensis]|nr:hypothetical protein [Dermatophilus congolensis]
MLALKASPRGRIFFGSQVGTPDIDHDFDDLANPLRLFTNLTQCEGEDDPASGIEERITASILLEILSATMEFVTVRFAGEPEFFDTEINEDLEIYRRVLDSHLCRELDTPHVLKNPPEGRLERVGGTSICSTENAAHAICATAGVAIARGSQFARADVATP